MLTPNGELAGGIDRIMLMSIWAKELDQKADDNKHPVIFAAMGKPTFPVNYSVTQTAADYWFKMGTRSQHARHFLSSSPKKQSKSKIDLIIQANGSVPYDDPRGILSARKKMAAALNHWYQLDDVFKPENVLFTVGGVAALGNVFEYLQHNFPHGRIVTSFPHYSLYAGVRGRKNFLHPIDVMKQQGYRLTAEALQESIDKAKQAAKIDGHHISAFLFCDPNNPLGTVISEAEWYKIAEVLRKEPDTLIILDEAYAEMVLNGEKNTSLVQIAPDLRQRIVLIRSATKGLSAAGERMAVMMAFNKSIMTGLLEYNIGINGHPPISIQYAYAEAMSTLDDIEHNNIIEFYAPQVKFVADRLGQIGAAMPDLDYKVEGTFYVLTDLSDLLGQCLEPAAKEALGKDHCGIIQTDEDIAYHLLFKHNILIAPLSYYGLDKGLGYLRITCSGGDTELLQLCNELEKALVDARINKYMLLLQECNSWLTEISAFNQNAIKNFKGILENFSSELPSLTDKSADQLKGKIFTLRSLLSDIQQGFNKVAQQDAIYCSSVTTIQTLFRSELIQNEYETQSEKQALAKIEKCFQNKQAELDQQKIFAIEQVKASREKRHSIFTSDLQTQSELIKKLSPREEILENGTDNSNAKRRLVF